MCHFNPSYTLLQVVSSAIIDKYIGESSRLIREMFGYARDHQVGRTSIASNWVFFLNTYSALISIAVSIPPFCLAVHHIHG